MSDYPPELDAAIDALADALVRAGEARSEQVAHDVFTERAGGILDVLRAG